MTPNGSALARPQRNHAMSQLAAGQHGVVTRRQLARSGFAPRTIDNWVASGRLERLHPAVYCVAGAPSTDHRALMAAVLAAGSGCLASHRSAAWLWGLGDPPLPEVVVPRSRRPRLHGVVVHHPLDLPKARRSVKDGIPVTNPLRTLVDLGAVCEADAVADAVERALIARLVTFRGLSAEWRRVAKPGRSGSGVLRRILDYRLLGEKPPDSVMEAKGAPLFTRSGLPKPVFQFVVTHGGRHVARVDFAYPALKVAIEFDGLDAHASAAALRRDLARQNRLMAAGWLVLRFTWADVIHRPGEVADEIAAVLSKRSAA